MTLSSKQNKSFSALKKLDIDVFPGYYNFIHYYPPLNRLPYCNQLKFDNEINSELSIYVHIPFCSSACKFCFYSKKIEPERDEVLYYLQQLSIEMAMYSKFLKYAKVKTLYIGGGSPSYLNQSEINILFENLNKHFNLSEIEEITFESEPNTLSFDKIIALKKNEVTRISVGVQSLNNDILKNYNRSHNRDLAIETIKHLSDSNINTFNIDFIYGLEGQTIDQIEETIEIIKKYSIPSITWYQLWYSSPKKLDLSWQDKIKSIDEIRQMKCIINNAMHNLDYDRNNLTWYVKNDKDRCKHYTFTWENNNFIGLGSSAYSYLNDHVFSNSKQLNKYYNSLKDGKFPTEFGRRISDKEKAKRQILLGLKTDKGIDLNCILDLFEVSFNSYFNNLIQELKLLGFIDFFKGNLMFTGEGILWADAILAKIMDQEIFN